MRDITEFLKDRMSKKGEESIDEAKNILGKGYTHFAIIKKENKIADGWDYKGVDKEDIKDFSKSDLADNYPDNKYGDFKVVTRKALEKTMDITDTNNWYKVTSESIDVQEKTFEKGQTLMYGQMECIIESVDDGKLTLNVDGEVFEAEISELV